MADVLIRGVPQDVVEKLKARASDNKRSLQQELLLVLQDAVTPRVLRGIELADRIRESLADSSYGDSTELIREDRER